MKHIIYFVLKIAALIAAFATAVFICVKVKSSRMKTVLSDNKGEGFVDTAIKILIAVVIGALVLAGLYLLFSGTILPTLTEKITEMFNYGG